MLTARGKQQGFTLMELIIAMVVIAVLTAIALPNYTAYIQRSRRAEARNTLLEAAAWMERWRTERGRYDSPPPAGAGTPPPIPFTVVPATGAVNYNVAVVTPLTGPPVAITYTITATAVGMMAGDPCATLTIDETGARNFTTGGGGTQEICWSR